MDAAGRPLAARARPSRRIYRAAIVVAYTAVFWIALPTALWAIASTIDASLGWSRTPWGPGWLVVGLGAALALWSMADLLRFGRGLPISALPPGRLCVQGAYGLARHPIYLAFNVAAFGVGLALGSRALAWIVAPAFAPCWMLYAAVEERGLLRRFGAHYRDYRLAVGMLPRLDLYRVVQLAMWLRLIPTRVVGREHLPRRGGAIVVANHACYIDGLMLGRATARRINYLVTAEVFRRPLLRWLFFRRLHAIPVRRYRVDPLACRLLLRRLERGELVGIFVEGERAPLGERQPALHEVAALLARLPYPVVPVGISGAYEVGPRWSDTLRRRPVDVRVGERMWLCGEQPQHAAAALDAALDALIDHQRAPRVHLEGLPRARLARVLWRCPRCLDDARWRAADVACDACGAGWAPSGDGRFVARSAPRQHAPVTLAELAQPVWQAAETQPLRCRARGAREVSMYGPLRPLCELGESELVVGRDGVRFGGALVVPIAQIRSVSTERADTLQVATCEQMWQFRLRDESSSAFRLHRAIERWREEAAR
ncbi:MAG: 1-acyl-sn-glycerol-3-phosphate acyltransferase [Myxococcales bacterium]|nr:1-acyl-sn-glycerol-3-phosphate acyltransferase [Myxococcales bacterium]